MSSQRKAEAVASENIVTTETSRLSDLWKKEDWLAVWIGFIIIAIGAVAVLTGKRRIFWKTASDSGGTWSTVYRWKPLQRCIGKEIPSGISGTVSSGSSGKIYQC